MAQAQLPAGMFNHVEKQKFRVLAAILVQDAERYRGGHHYACITCENGGGDKPVINYFIPVCYGVIPLENIMQLMQSYARAMLANPQASDSDIMNTDAQICFGATQRMGLRSPAGAMRENCGLSGGARCPITRRFWLFLRK